MRLLFILALLFFVACKEGYEPIEEPSPTAEVDAGADVDDSDGGPACAENEVYAQLGGEPARCFTICDIDSECEEPEVCRNVGPGVCVSPSVEEE